MGEDTCICSWRVQEAYALSNIHLNELYTHLISQGASVIRLHPAWSGGSHSEIYNWQGLNFPGTLGPINSLSDIENTAIYTASAYTGFPGSSSYLYSAIEHVENRVYEGEAHDRRVYVDSRGEKLTLPIALLHLFDDKCSPQTICVAFLNRLFSDSLLLPLHESIRYCEERNFPRVKAVKGITDAVVANAILPISLSKISGGAFKTPHRTHGESFLGNLVSRHTIVEDDATKQKRKKKKDIHAKKVIDDLCCLSRWRQTLGEGPFNKLIANAAVSMGEAVLLSGISRQALMSAAKNVFKLQDMNSFPLLQLAELAGNETVLVGFAPWRESYQYCVKNYISDCIKDEYKNALLNLCAHYLDMKQNEAKHCEAGIHVLAGYLNMYPPEQGQPNSETDSNEIPPSSLSHLDQQPQLVSVNVPPWLWAGKTAKAVFGALRDLGYDDALIALVISEKCRSTKTDTGRLFLPEGSDDSVYRRKLDTLMEEGKQRYTLTFNG